jgi:O-antigen/teichoic acid export membrane protein
MNSSKKSILNTISTRLRQRFITRFTEALPAGRNRRVSVGIVSGVLTKGMAFLFTLITVPMTLHYLGPERYGIWVTMISILAWISMVDLGIANGLLPLLSAAFGKGRDDLAREYVATAFWSLIAIAILAGSVITICWGLFDWSHIFNIEDINLELQVSTAMALAVGIFLVTLPLSIIQRIYLAYQQGLTANLWQFLASLAGVIGLYLVTRTQGGLVYLVLGFSGVQLLVLLANSVWLFGWSKPQLRPFVRPNLTEAKHVMSMGGMFFLNQIATLAIFQKDIILISHYLGPAEATPYSVTWQMFLYLNIINILIAPYLGPALGDAFAKGDISWMRKMFSRYILTTCAIALPAVALLAWFYKPILAAWVGPGVVPTTDTVLWLSIWTVVLSVQWPIITLLNNTGHLRTFTIVYGIAACFNIIFSIPLINLIGVHGGIMASVITMVVLVLLPSLREVRILLEPR